MAGRGEQQKQQEVERGGAEQEQQGEQNEQHLEQALGRSRKHKQATFQISILQVQQQGGTGAGPD